MAFMLFFLAFMFVFLDSFHLSKAFQKPTSEVRLVEAGFTDQTIAALYILPFKLTKNT